MKITRKPAASGASRRARQNAQSAFVGKKLFFVSILSIMLIVPFMINAADTVVIESPIGPTTFGELIGTIANMLQVVAIAIGVVMIIIAGIQYMTSVGNEEKAKKARQTITYSLIGVAIVSMAKFIVDLVQEILKKK